MSYVPRPWKTRNAETATDGRARRDLRGSFPGTGAPSVRVSATAIDRHVPRLAIALTLALFLAAATFLALRAAPTADAQGTFPGQGFLPDNRAWEMVSPPDKNGGEVTPTSFGTRAGSSGDALQFTSLVGFGDAVGSSTVFQYISRRTPSPGTRGWSTHAITPRQESGTVNLGTLSIYGRYDLFDDDLDTGLYFSSSALTNDPDTERAINLYRRQGLSQPGSALNASIDLLTPCPACSDGVPFPPDGPIDRNLAAFNPPRTVGASESFDKVAFLSPLALTPDAAGMFRSMVYKWDAAAGLSLVGVVPPGADIECTGAGCVAPAGGGSGPGRGNTVNGIGDEPYYPHVVSNDGSRVFFTAPTTGSRGICQGSCSTYMRDDQGTPDDSDDTTIKLNASERTDCADDPSCGGNGVPDPAPDPGGAKRAIYQDASSDGDYVFFRSDEALTDDALLAGSISSNLYRYDATKPPSAPNNLTLVSSDIQPLGTTNGLATNIVIGGAEDGSTIYFADSASSLSQSVYRWREGGGTELLVDNFGTGLPLLRHNFHFGDNQAQASRVSSDGRFLTLPLMYGFETGHIGPTGYDHGNCSNRSCLEIYLYDGQANGGDGELHCASCRPSGAPASTDAEINFSFRRGAFGASSQLPRALSEDGRYVFFSTAEKLVPEDVNGVTDAYVFDSQSGLQSLLSSGQHPKPSYFIEASEDGSSAFILTQEPLSAWDVDDVYDIYDARVDGGQPEPPVAAAPCSGNDACLGPASDAPGGGVPGSASDQGEGNPKPAAAPNCATEKRQLGKAKKKAKRLKKKAKKASGKTAKKLKKKAKKAKKKAKKAKRELGQCRRGEGS